MPFSWALRKFTCFFLDYDLFLPTRGSNKEVKWRKSQIWGQIWAEGLFLFSKIWGVCEKVRNFGQ